MVFFRKRNLVRPIFTPKLLCHFTFITNYLSVLTVNERAGFKMSPQRVPLNFQILSGRSKALPGEAAGEYSLNIHGFKWTEGRNRGEIWDN